MHTLNLNGTWQLKKAGAENVDLCKVEVPGTVLSGLLTAGKIEDPFYRTNEDQTRALFWDDYMFERTFSVSKKLLEEEQINLVCEGLDTLADITINDKALASTDNMHRTWTFSVKEYLQEGENTIRIVFRSVLKYIEAYEYEENKEVKYVPSGGMKGNHLLRKAHSMFGWDWGPQTIDAGIFRDISLQAYSHARIEDVRIRQEHGEAVVVKTEVMLSGNVKDMQKYCVRVHISEHNVANVEKTRQEWKKPVTAEAVVDGEFPIEQPKLWWPNGYGEQPLYDVIVELLDEQDQVLETVCKRIGLRTLTISQEKDEWGSEFAFCVNGLKIFTRGGNYIPDDCLYTRISREKQEYILESCKRAHFNCVRVWGGGYYPSDEFYDMCDEKGLIVWQDLMYACNVYDVTDAFAENCRQETLDNVKRLRHHASLGMWCGNNEIESAWDHWGDFQEETPYLRADYIKLFEDVLPKAVAEADGETFYWRSSPSSGGCFDDPDNENRGDNHYWDVWHGQKPFTDYQKYYFRFCSEFGFQSFPCMKTIESFTEEKDRNIFSRVMENHQKNDAANGKILYYLSENFQYPADLEHLSYVSQVLQAIAIKYGVDHWRRNRGRCMGTLYWQINDDWPVASWSSIDYFGRWKALHYLAQKFYAPLVVSMKLEENACQVYLSNEQREAQNYEVTFYVKDMKGRVVQSYQTEGSIAAFSAGSIQTIDLVPFLDRQYEVFLEAVVHTKDGLCLSDVETMVPYKYLELESPNIRIDVREEADAFVITLQSDCFTPFVAIDFTQTDAILEENFFHLTDDRPKEIRVAKSDVIQGAFADAEDMKKQLKWISLKD